MLSGYFLLLLKSFIEKHKLDYFYAYTKQSVNQWQ